MGANSRKRLRWRGKLLLLAFGIVAGILCAELGFRIITTEADGYPEVRGVRLVPLMRVTEDHRAVLASLGESTYTIYDPELGWTLKPDGRHGNGLFATNADGLRSAPRPLPAVKGEGVRRVLLVGDSFTHGDEVAWEDTWSAQLEEVLGPPWEVWNGGVGGYGSGQALLRMKRLWDRVDPDVVVLGIFSEDLERNVNLFRPLLHHWTHMPFSKPRFVEEEGELRLINSPVTVPPEKIAETLEHFEDFPLKAHEAFWFPPLYEQRWFYHSRVLRFLASRRVHAAFYNLRQRLVRPGGEAVRVTAGIAGRFIEDVERRGARPVVVYFPSRLEVPSYAPDRQRPVQWPLFAELRERGTPFVDMGPDFQAAAEKGGLEAVFVGGVGHPNRGGGRVIAERLAREIAP